MVLMDPFPVLTGETSDDRIDEGYYYRLTNSYLGEASSLDTAPDAPNAPFMAKSGDYSGQYWKFTFHDGCYRLTNMFLGPDRSLDTYGWREHSFHGPERRLQWTALAFDPCWRRLCTADERFPRNLPFVRHAFRIRARTIHGRQR